MSLLVLASVGSVLLTILFVLICILLIFMVVITPSQEGGMAAAFGGMGSDTFFGTKAHQHINKFTVFLAVSFLLLAVFINRINVGQSGPTPSGTTPLEEKMKTLPPEKQPGAPDAPK
jgi:protein translocase SecG subunit